MCTKYELLCKKVSYYAKKPHLKLDVVLTMELAGIEPASESPSIAASPITVYLLSFPQPNADRQAFGLGSFINLLSPQSFGDKGPR